MTTRIGSRRNVVTARLVLLVFCFSLAALSQNPDALPLERISKLPGLSNIKHVVFIIKENRSFDNLFATFPGANGATSGTISTGQVLPLQPLTDAVPHDICHGWECFILAINYGKMDGFDLQNEGAPCNLNGDYECYGMQTPEQLPNYWTYAQQFALADDYFTSIKTATTPNHLYTVGAQALGILSTVPAGCDSPPSGLLTVIDAQGNISSEYACVEMPTLMDELEQAGVSWRYYVNTSLPFDSMELISHLRYGPLWSNNVSDSEFATDVVNGTLPQVSWLMAPGEATDHPPYSLCFGENYTVKAINAIMNSKYWTTEPTAIFITWDDSGGWYDHIAPPILDQYGPGARAPLLVISPYTPDTAGAGSITHVQYEHSSVLTFIEDLFNLKPLSNRDGVQANHMASDLALFNFQQALRDPLVLTPRQCSPASSATYSSGGAPGVLNFVAPQPVGTPSPAETVTLRNFNSTRLTFSNIALSGSSDFSQTNTCANGLAPLKGESPAFCVVSVTFTPSASGVRTATLTVTDNDPTSPQITTITGTGTNLALNPPLLGFGTQLLSSSSGSQSATLTNLGSLPITISNIVASGDFSQSNNCGSTLGAGATCTISAVFTPSATGTRYGTVSITDGDGASPHVVGLTGVATQVTLTPPALAFPSQAVGTVSSAQVATLTNLSSNPLPIFSIALTGDNEGRPDTATVHFQQTNDCGTSLAAGASCSIRVKFSPHVQGPLVADLMVFECPQTSSPPCVEGDSPQTVVLNGTATASRNNPAPLLAQAFRPSAAAPGSSSVVVTVNGANFGTKSIVKWNGTSLTTTFVNGHQVKATIPAANLAVAATGNVTVVNATPGGGASAVAYFQVATPAASIKLTRKNLSPGNGPKSVIVADFNGDGNPDFAVLNNTDSTATVFKGTGNGTFTKLAPFNTGGTNPVAGAVGDFNHDGKLDLVVAHLQGNSLSILLGNGDGTFTKGAILPAVEPSDIQVADFNRDGNLDLVYPISVGPVVGLMMGNGDGTFRSISTPPFIGTGPLAVALGDFNGDNKVDLAVACSLSNNISILLGNGDGTFTLGTQPSTGNKPVALVAGDFNGDNILDLAVANQTDNTISILQGTGTGSFTLLSTAPVTGTSPVSIVTGDFNADNKPDLAVANGGSNSVSLFLGNGDGTFQARADTTVGAGPASVAIGDFNKDGLLDFVSANQAANAVSVLLASPGTH